MNSKIYNAPWGNCLRWMSALSCVIFVAILILMFYAGENHHWSRWLVLLLPLAVVPGTIRSYTIEPGAVVIQRLLWNTRLPLAGLISAAAQPDAMRRSLRLCGNGGMFSFTGWYRNPALGNYRAFVTDLNSTVVLKFATRTVVVSPERPEEFVREILNRPMPTL
jgi:hypothetical protein